MGTLHYGAPPASYDLDDRTLAHVELVVVAKLRRNESFALTLDGKGGKRSTLWINSAATLRFDFDFFLALRTHCFEFCGKRLGLFFNIF